jgi:general stress protein 26
MGTSTYGGNGGNGGNGEKKHLHELLASFDTAMLITRHHEGNHARPMAVASVEGSDSVWFVMSLDSPKAEEIREDPRVSATFQAGRKFVALSGHAEIVRDREKIRALWKDLWKVWFPNGKDDPSIALIRVSVDDAELWDDAGSKGVKYVEGQHARIKTDREVASPRR